jgi:hypothetical protein
MYFIGIGPGATVVVADPKWWPADFTVRSVGVERRKGIRHDGDVGEHAAGYLIIIPDCRWMREATLHRREARGQRHDMVTSGDWLPRVPLSGQHHHLAPDFAVDHPGMATQPVGQVGDDIA